MGMASLFAEQLEHRLSVQRRQYGKADGQEEDEKKGQGSNADFLTLSKSYSSFYIK